MMLEGVPTSRGCRPSGSQISGLPQKVECLTSEEGPRSRPSVKAGSAEGGAYINASSSDGTWNVRAGRGLGWPEPSARPGHSGAST